jgi:hypothetical protein
MVDLPNNVDLKIEYQKVPWRLILDIFYHQPNNAILIYLLPISVWQFTTF